MGSPVDLTLGCSAQALPSSNGCHSLESGSMYPGDYLESLRKAEEYLRSLEDERRKVEGFKRELPLCIQLLDNAIQMSKEKVASGKMEQQLTRSSMDCENETYSRPRLEEFMPLNMNLPLKRRWGADAENEGGSDGETEDTSDRGPKRPVWMAEAQLWTQTSVSSDQTRHEKEKETEQFLQEQSPVTSSQQQQQQQQLSNSKERPTGAFLPFLREQPGTSAGSPLTVARPVPRTAGSGAGLSLSFGEPLASPFTTVKTVDSEVTSIDPAAPGLQTPEAGNSHQEDVAMAAGTVACNAVSGAGSSSGGQSNRKARRCWSPELHRRFVSALHQLGGCQIATPKQIRELMKVDGLTNDEVKSHLQKYRLHTRRPSPSPQAAGGVQPPPQLVVLGGIWVPPKYAASGSSQPGSSGVYDQTQHLPQLMAPDGSYFACISDGTSGAPVQVHHHRQPIFEPQQAGSQSQCSPQGPLQLNSQLSGATQGPSSEVYYDESGEEEEAKSDSRSRKTSTERDSSEIRSSSIQPATATTTTSSELPKSNLNLPLACSTVQSTVVNAASAEEEVNQQQQAQ